MKKNKIKVGVIGGGIIGAGNILKGKQIKYVDEKKNKQSHSGVINSLRNFKLNFIVDNNINIIKKLKINYSCPIYSDIKEVPKDQYPDILTVCVPDKLHYDMLKKIIIFSPKLVIIEKPISLNPSLTKKITKIYNDKGIKLIVNYSRRFVPFFLELSRKLKNEKIIACNIAYSNGTKHNGCHVLDLIQMLFGKIINFKVLSFIEDYSVDDPTVSAFINTKRCPSCLILALDNRNYVHWEMDIYTENFKYKIDNDHRNFTIYKVKDNIGDPPGKRLIMYKVKNINYESALKNLYKEAEQRLNDNHINSFNLGDAIDVEDLTYKMVNSAKYLKKSLIIKKDK